MARDWDSLFENWRKPPSETEEAKATAVRDAITRAIKADATTNARNPSFLLHGSYGNNTNVRHNSDVDVAVILREVFISDYSQAPGLTREKMGYTTVDYALAQFRTDAENALRKGFGAERVHGKNKAVHIKETASHLDADVIACFGYRRHRADGKFWAGVTFQTLAGVQVVGSPDQTLENGNRKTNATGRRYKRVVRILKRLTFEMAEKGYATEGATPGCLIESLCYNLPDSTYGNDTYRKDVRAVVAAIYGAVNEGRADKWTEVNELEYLFRAGQKWDKAGVLAWAKAVWNYAELG